ncbi:MAG: DUF5329 domain-containing protein [Spirochaetales bacterium]|nr:DUF5329 domain-containing protein [Spirochaetales bacterium]
MRTLNKRKIVVLFVASLMALFVSHPTTASNLTEEQKIERLLQAVAQSDLVFIRGGSEYGPTEASEHLRMKYNQVRSRIDTAEEFIEHIASRSYLLGTPYYVRFSDGRTVESGTWLSQRLREIEAEACCEVPR